MTLIKDLIDIPERVQKGDFVLKLTEGVNDPAETLREYVVTPELAKCFDSALLFIRSAVQGRTSKATYLHGSFGSGKSHFMAVLHLILQGNPAARGIPELAAVIQKHNDWLVGKKFLLVPYHMIGAHDMESGILGNYVEFMRRTHPTAPVPPVYVSASLIEQASSERASYGDELFFKRLNAGKAVRGGEDLSRDRQGAVVSSHQSSLPHGRGSKDSQPVSSDANNWGDLDSAWDASSFEAAAAAQPDSESHLRLVSTLLKTVASSHAEVISNRGGNFVRFDKGLSLISQHAKSQGYDALILFLDELILWLAMNSADLGFVKREAAKLTNLVEAQSADRPIPLISFVARQRDLRELVGDHVPGAEKLSFSDSLDWQGGRFDTITLEDRNLPAIAEKRVLKCKSIAARQQLDAAFDQTVRMKDNVMNILLTQEGDRQMFRRVYPFSPALVQTLIAVSSVLQRERTALKVMMQLLVDHREDLKVGDLVPVGDLFDVVAHGDEAFSPEMAIHFDNAKRLYHQKLLPMLEKSHAIRREAVELLPYDDLKRAAFRNDDRLVKTLLLSALVPEVESLRGLNSEKLAALNHGTIKVPVPGTEGREVLRRIRNWAATAGEIRIGEESNPTISVQLSGVDTESIIEQARREDNQGNRVRRVRQMLFDQLGIQGEGEFERYHDFLWRNTRRTCQVLFGNIRELPPSSLENGDEPWRLIIDFPFDEAGHGPRDDIAKLDEFKTARSEGAKTLCWVPSFFSPEAQKDLGMLVILEHILMGERFGTYSNHLSPQDRQGAKSVLESQRNQLRQRVQNHLDAAYGLEALSLGSLDTTHDLELNEHYVSLSPGFVAQPPAAANLQGAMLHLLTQCLNHEFPAGPHFETEVKPSVLKKVLEQVEPATQTADGRIAVDKTLRPLLRQIANPLLLGEMGVDATHFVLGQYWKTHFSLKAKAVGGTITVKQLRDWMDEPKPMGLSKEAQNLVILTFAAQTNKTFYLHGGPYEEPTLTTIPDPCELRNIDLPSKESWEPAVQRANRIFGINVSGLLSNSNVGHLTTDVKKKAADTRRAMQAYCERLKEGLTRLGLSVEESDRLKTATATRNLVDQICDAESSALVGLLANAQIATSETAMGECVGRAAELEGNLEAISWDLFAAIGKFDDERRDAAQLVLQETQQALASDEHAVQLAATLKGAQAKAVDLLSRTAAVATPKPLAAPVNAPPVVPPETKRGQTIVAQGAKQNLTLQDAKDLLSELDSQVRPGDSARLSVSWIIEGGTPKP